MYKLLLLIPLFCFLSCDDETASHCLSAGDHFTLADGSEARIAQIRDSRCSCNADCSFTGQVNLTLLIGSDTILSDSEGYGFGTSLAIISPEQHIYQTRRGDQFEIIDYGPNTSTCPGSVPQENFCLQIEILE